MLSFKTTITLDDYKDKNCYVFLRTSFYRLYAFTVLVLISVYLLVGILHFQSLQETIWTIIFVLIFTRYVFLRTPKFICIKLAERKSDFPKDVEYIFQGDGFRIKTETAECFVRWSEVISIRETKEYIFFDGKDNYWFSIYKNLISKEIVSSIKSFLLDNPDLTDKFISEEKNKESFWTTWVSKI